MNNAIRCYINLISDFGRAGRPSLAQGLAEPWPFRREVAGMSNWSDRQLNELMNGNGRRRANKGMTRAEMGIGRARMGRRRAKMGGTKAEKLSALVFRAFGNHLSSFPALVLRTSGPRPTLLRVHTVIAAGARFPGNGGNHKKPLCCHNLALLRPGGASQMTIVKSKESHRETLESHT